MSGTFDGAGRAPRPLRGTGLFYFRFMDEGDSSTHALVRSVLLVSQTLDELPIEQHPHKTFIGRVEPDFDFLACEARKITSMTGAAFPPESITQNPNTVKCGMLSPSH